MTNPTYPRSIKESAAECIEDGNFKTALSWYLDLLRITTKDSWHATDYQGLPWWHQSKKHRGFKFK